ncbi:MAG: GtrA family protein [Spirochaetales bacterium]|nr:GtrA family protein [Spirochaetales bacterium]
MNLEELFYQIIKFGIVGVANTAICTVFYFVFNKKLHFPKELSIILAYIIAFGNSFFWNKIWTFSDTAAMDIIQLIFFLAVFLVSLLIKLGLFRLLYHIFSFKAEFKFYKFHVEWAFLISMAVYTAVFFVGSRLFVFT